MGVKRVGSAGGATFGQDLEAISGTTQRVKALSGPADADDPFPLTHAETQWLSEDEVTLVRNMIGTGLGSFSVNTPNDDPAFVAIVPLIGETGGTVTALIVGSRNGATDRACVTFDYYFDGTDYVLDGAAEVVQKTGRDLAPAIIFSGSPVNQAGIQITPPSAEDDEFWNCIVRVLQAGPGAA